MLAVRVTTKKRLDKRSFLFFSPLAYLAGTTVLDSSLPKWTLDVMKRSQRGVFFPFPSSDTVPLYFTTKTMFPHIFRVLTVHLNFSWTDTRSAPLLWPSSCPLWCSSKEGRRWWDGRWWTIKGELYRGPSMRYTCYSYLDCWTETPIMVGVFILRRILSESLTSTSSSKSQRKWTKVVVGWRRPALNHKRAAVERQITARARKTNKWRMVAHLTGVLP